MSTDQPSEVWQRGPVAGFEPLLMPVVHALLQVREDIARLVDSVPPEHVWLRKGGAASIGFHVRHTGGALDRLFTYARGELLSDAQRSALAIEQQPGDPRRRFAQLQTRSARSSIVRSSSCDARPRARCWIRGASGARDCPRR